MEVRASPRHYEFRIEGRLGRSILRYLRWAFRLEKERTVVRVATQRELRMILEQLAESGIQIDHCIRRSAA
jgi:carbon monoxide dehydrogenase subunit G